MKIRFWFGNAVILLFAFLSSLPAASHILTMDEVIALSLKHSPDIDSSRFDFEGALQRTKAAEGLYLPSVDLRADAGKQHSGFKQSHSDVDILTGTLGASQLLYDFGKTSGLIGSSREEALAYRAQMQQRISDKIYRVKKAYYDVLKSKSIIEVQSKNVNLQKQQLRRAQRYLASGIKTIIDVSDAQVQVEQAKLNLENARYDLELKRAILEEEMGVTPYGGSYSLYSKKLHLPHLSRGLPVVRRSLGALESFAYAHRYALQGSAHTISSTRSHVKTSQGEYYPTLSVGAHYTEQYVDESAALIQPERQGEVAVQMHWNLFSGYRTDAKVQESKIAVLKAVSHMQSVKLAIRHQVVDSYIGVKRNRQNVTLSESIAKASLKKFDQAQKRYENDLSDYVELQDAQQGYIESLSNLVTAYYDYYISLAQLEHAIGK